MEKIKKNNFFSFEDLFLHRLNFEKFLTNSRLNANKLSIEGYYIYKRLKSYIIFSFNPIDEFSNQKLFFGNGKKIYSLFLVILITNYY